MASSTQNKERRRSPRRAALMDGVIFYPNQDEHIICSVHDLSQDGALLELPSARKLPLVFWLRLDGETVLRFCTVAWQSENHLGVEFSEQIIERHRIERWGEPASMCTKPHLPA